MQKIRFGRTNVHVPTVSLGTWGHGGANKNAEGVSVGWSGHDDNAARDALRVAYRNGITHWDTADAYGNGRAEELIGSMWSEVPRSEIFVATKVGWLKGSSPTAYEPKFMRGQCESSMRRLRVDVIDLYYFHHCDFGPDDQYLDDAIETMRALQKEGKVRFVGLSDWNLGKVVKFIPSVDPDVVQPYRNIVDDDYEPSGLKQMVDQRDLGVAFFSPIKHGLLLGKYDKPVHFGEGDVRSRIAQFKDPEFIERMKRAAKAVGDRFGTPEPVLHGVIGALLTSNPTACVLLGMRNAAQAEAAATVGDALSEEDAAWVKQTYGA